MRPASSQMTSPSPRLRIVVARRWRCASTRSLAVGEVGAHRVERDAEGLELLRAARRHARAEVAGGHPPRGGDEVVQRPAHRADQQREEREHADEREAGAEARSPAAPCASGRRVASRALVAAGLLARRRGAARRCAPPRRWRVADAARGVDRRMHGERRGVAAGGRDRRRQRAAGVVAGGEPRERARRTRRSCARRRRRSSRRGASAAARGWPAARRSRPAGSRPRPRARRRSATLVLVALAGVVERRDAERADDRRAGRQPEQRELQRAWRSSARRSTPIIVRWVSSAHGCASC